MICRNRSNVSKYLSFIISQVLYVVQEINYLSCFIVYYEIKQKKASYLENIFRSGQAQVNRECLETR